MRVNIYCLLILTNTAVAATLKSHVDYLSSDALEGRRIGTRGEQIATQYAADHLQKNGLDPAGDKGSYFQIFHFSNLVGRNVIAKLNANSTAPVIVIGAHIDHLGRGEWQGSRARKEEMNAIHPGADDNASGVAIVLEAAARLNTLKTHGLLKLNRTILFVLWSGEEYGLLGSAYFIKNFPAKIDAYINLDMVGRLQKNLVVQAVGSSKRWPPLIAAVNQKQDLSIVTQSDPYLPTDSISFYLHDIPSINLFTGSHDEYHTPRDTSATLNYAGMTKITDYLVNLTLALENNSENLPVQRVLKPTAQAKRGFKIYLGTIPDYTSDIDFGVKLSGVSADSPADHAGLKANDIILKLAGKNIADIYQYTNVLNALRANKKVKMLVQRDNKQVTLTIMPLAR